MLQLTMLAHSKEGGAINLGIYPTLGSRWLMPQLAKLFQKYDNLTVNTITYLSNEELDPSRIDIAITQGDPPFTGFRDDYLMPESLKVVAAKSLLSEPVVDPYELLKFRSLQHSTRPETWKIWYESIGLELANSPIGPMFSQFEMLIDAVKAGHGIGIVPHVLVKNELAKGQLVKAHEHVCTPKSAYYLLTPSVKVGIEKIERVRNWLLKEQ
ncbi:MAG: LysR substrate-binding domain-containing protein [Granulosicoccaceae bacterium]